MPYADTQSLALTTTTLENDLSDLNNFENTGKIRGIKSRLRPQSKEKREKMRQLAASDHKKHRLSKQRVNYKSYILKWQRKRGANVKKRREIMSSAFEELQNALGCVTEGRRLNRIDTLLTAIAHIKHLSALLEENSESALFKDCEANTMDKCKRK